MEYFGQCHVMRLLLGETIHWLFFDHCFDRAIHKLYNHYYYYFLRIKPYFLLQLTYMDFPINFQVRTSIKYQGSYSEATLVMMPLAMILKEKNESISYQYQLLINKNTDTSSTLTHCFAMKEELIYIRMASQSDFYLSSKIFFELLPLSNFNDTFTSEGIYQELTNQSLILMKAKSRAGALPKMIRSFDLSKQQCRKEIQMIRSLNQRCILKPQCYYVEKKNQYLVKLVYRSINGIYLKNFLKKKKFHAEADIKEFVTKLLFLIKYLAQRQIYYPKLELCIILKNSKLKHPLIIDLGGGTVDQYSEQSHIKILGEIMFKFIFVKSCDKNEVIRLRKYLAGIIPAYHQCIANYSKETLIVLNDLLTAKNKAIDLIKNKWFLTTGHTKKLQTIIELHQQEKTAKTLLPEEQDEAVADSTDEETGLDIRLKMYQMKVVDTLMLH